MDSENDMIASFVGVTDADVDTARQMLTATDFKLEEAINLFFASGGGSGASTATAAGQGTGGPAVEDGETRAPLPIQRSRSLYEEDMAMPAAGLMGLGGFHGDNPEAAVAAARDMALNAGGPFDEAMHDLVFGGGRHRAQREGSRRDGGGAGGRGERMEANSDDEEMLDTDDEDPEDNAGDGSDGGVTGRRGVRRRRAAQEDGDEGNVRKKSIVFSFTEWTGLQQFIVAATMTEKGEDVTLDCDIDGSKRAFTLTGRWKLTCRARLCPVCHARTCCAHIRSKNIKYRPPGARVPVPSPDGHGVPRKLRAGKAPRGEPREMAPRECPVGI